MPELWTALIAILLADIVNPVLFAFMVYAVGTDRPVVNSISALAGHTAAHLTFGIILALSFNAITARLENPEPIDYGLGFLIGILLLWVAWRSRSEKRQQPDEPRTDQATPLRAFGIGAVINIVGLPFALPYFAAIDQILKTDLNATHSALVVRPTTSLMRCLFLPYRYWLLSWESAAVPCSLASMHGSIASAPI